MNASKSTVPGIKVATPIGTSTKPAAGSIPAGMANPCHNKHIGKLVSITGNKLVMTSHEGREYSHTVATDATVCCDGHACKSAQLKAGSKIRLTTKRDDDRVAVKIESLDRHAEFAQPG